VITPIKTNQNSFIASLSEFSADQFKQAKGREMATDTKLNSIYEYMITIDMDEQRQCVWECDQNDVH